MDKKVLSLRRQNIFFNNLLALGFDSAAMSKEHKIKFDKKMFLLPNRKGMEVVSYFLWSKLNEISRGRFKIIWPLVDTKDQRQFQKTSFEYLTRIAQESEIKFPPVLNSVFSSFGGEAFFDLYFAFSTHVVQQVNKTYGPMLRRPKYNPKFTKHAIETLIPTSINCVDKFKLLTDTTKFHLETYFSIAKKLSDCVERLKLSNSQGQSVLEEKIKTAIKILNGLVENSLEGLTLKNKEYQDKITVLWRKLENFISKEEKMWDHIASELEDSAKPILKGSDYSFSLCNKLKDCYEARYQNQLPEKEKHLCIPIFLKLFTVVLEFYVDSIKRGKFSETYKLEFLKDTSELEKSLKMLQSFSALLDEGNEVNKQRVQTLMEEINLDAFIEENSDFIKDLPPSPEECSKPILDDQNKNRSIFFYPYGQDGKLQENIAEVPLVTNFQKFVCVTPSKSSNIYSPIQTTEKKSLISLTKELNKNDLNRSADEGTFYEKSLQCSIVIDSVGFKELTTKNSVGFKELTTKDSVRFKELTTKDSDEFKEFITKDSDGFKELTKDSVGFKELSTKNSVGIKGLTATDSGLDVSEFDIPLDWLHEESLNSQTLSDQASLSFLD